SLGFIDRFIVTAEAYSIPVTLVFNKSDLKEKELADYRNQMMRLYTEIGYECILVSALSGENVEGLKQKLIGKVNLFAGHSGVGKSTLINALHEGIEIKTAEISETYQKGKHTTTFAQMYEMKDGGFIIDTPGLKEFGLFEISKEELSHYFIEMLEVLPDCKFNNCMHIREHKCAVKDAVEQKIIHPARYESYLKMLEEDTWR
ncbi:MAG: ribosome small subunit-dependent GTPase A, partial [Bacteroidia bacterium]|nr:ribosome small subunit-dependent GTPase A [Bacteroidia bacterium]NNM15447.1 ribosome small subunit-dependent GTPase A [Bacteroidia bacterium]